MRCVIVGDSPDFESSTVAEAARQGLAVVALDGAALKLPQGVQPAIVCGDFDSLHLPEARRRFPGAEFVELADQGENDLEKALRLILSRGAREATLCCVLGGRPDQNLANLGVIVRHHLAISMLALHRGMECRVASPGAQVRLVLKPGDEVSVVPFGQSAQISLSGVQWPLNGELLHMGSHGVSNRALGGEVVASPASGEVFVFSPWGGSPVRERDAQ